MSGPSSRTSTTGAPDGPSHDPRSGIAHLYRAPDVPTPVAVPSLRCLAVDGRGDPNTAPAYRDAVATLYAVSYALRGAVKAEGGAPWTVMPLEGLWWADDPASFRSTDRSGWRWTMLIVQPEVVTAERAAAAAAQAVHKGRAPSADALRLTSIEEGEAWHVLHHGPYSAEGPTIAALHAAIAAAGLALGGAHHEVYLSDPRRVAAERMRTILRQPVAPG